jgi:hypothetical protein
MKYLTDDCLRSGRLLTEDRLGFNIDVSINRRTS